MDEPLGVIAAMEATPETPADRRAACGYCGRGCQLSTDGARRVRDEGLPVCCLACAGEHWGHVQILGSEGCWVWTEDVAGVRVGHIHWGAVTWGMLARGARRFDGPPEEATSC
jgi:hypothetical protein